MKLIYGQLGQSLMPPACTQWSQVGLGRTEAQAIEPPRDVGKMDQVEGTRHRVTECHKPDTSVLTKARACTDAVRQAGKKREAGVIKMAGAGHRT